MLDSFNRALDQAADEFNKSDPDRVVVQLDTFHPADSSIVTAIGGAPSVAHIDAGLRLPVTALAADPDDDLDLLVELIDFDQAAWTPTLVQGAEVTGDDRIVLARKAADDLGLEVGDVVTVRHPVRVDAERFVLSETDHVVSGIHANPIRTFAFLDLAAADRFGLRGAVNVVQAYPADGSSAADIQRSIFGLEGVASSQPIARVTQAIDQALDRFLSFFVVTAVAVLALALLISFNATRITVEERQREHATMQAFGLPVRTVLAVVVKESVLVGVAATAIGVGAGAIFVQWMLTSLATTTLPDVGIGLYVSPSTIAIAVIVGIVAVATAPLFLIGRLRRMNLPDTLRVME
jgi:putative ABC transport system permease protein